MFLRILCNSLADYTVAYYSSYNTNMYSEGRKEYITSVILFVTRET
jgi:hypothetical protein